MIKQTTAFVLLTSLLPLTASAQRKEVTDVRNYCEAVEKQIVALANSRASANQDSAKFASDQPTADASEFVKAISTISSTTESLKAKEIEWYHLGCAQILYRRPSDK